MAKISALHITVEPIIIVVSLGLNLGLVQCEHTIIAETCLFHVRSQKLFDIVALICARVIMFAANSVIQSKLNILRVYSRVILSHVIVYS